MNEKWPRTGIRPGETVAVTVGSRGIANLALMTWTICNVIKSHGAVPVIIPAMGSHGGGTAEGQKGVLAMYGVTEEAMGARIDQRMNVRFIGKSPEGLKIYVAKSALMADHIIVFNRIKAHTDFIGDIESGLCKIMAIGLGKIAGATFYHRAVLDFGCSRAVEAAGRYVAANSKLAMGLGIIEDAYDNTALIKALLPDELVEEEKKLLLISKQWMGRLPFKDMHCLIVDRIGKDISGTGMDPNVTGRLQSIYNERNLPEPRIRRIYARSLTPVSEGNATGMGRADFINRRYFYDRIDFKYTYVNCFAGLSMENGKMPLVVENDQVGLEMSRNACGLVPTAKLRLVWIRDTLTLSEVLVSNALLPECREREDLSVLGSHPKMDFDAEGYLPESVVF
jgi:Uncharacterized conserved protein (DUF2088).